ncbi:hypothetical protein B0H16DRAFT_273904 [Mycena metata]|uniref:Uncharacterized protein n=1 Tax=Mycena metata TaxID=1033252 RepID=A0AAD7JP53_9AGAR|nr:hypothetical protein B0H16DRAFT_273904 [Mycena metata]
MPSVKQASANRNKSGDFLPWTPSTLSKPSALCFRSPNAQRGTPVCVLNTKTAKSKPSGMKSRALLSNVEKSENDLSDLNRLLEEERKLSAFRMDAACVAVEELRAPVYQTAKELAQAERTLHALADRQTGFLLALGAPLALLWLMRLSRSRAITKTRFTSKTLIYPQKIARRPFVRSYIFSAPILILSFQSPVLTTRQATSPTELTEPLRPRLNSLRLWDVFLTALTLRA